MDELSHLLYRGESEALDFKREQYPFVGAEDHKKAELLKDILAMANAWRNETAYILIGVDAPPGATKTINGITEHLDDADIQQFVNSKTQRPIQFNYFESSLEGKTIGVLQIPVQKRPFHLKNNYVNLKADAVYLRRGSSTSVAPPDEIFLMGEDQKKERIDIKLEFADFHEQTLLGNSIHLSCLKLIAPDRIPDNATKVGNLAIYMGNREYYRELFKYASEDCFLKPIGLTVTNNGNSIARHVRVELQLQDPDQIWKIKDNLYLDNHILPRADGPSLYHYKPKQPTSKVKLAGSKWTISFDVGDLQPKRTLWPAIQIFAGACASDTYTLKGTILAEHLPQPTEAELSIAVDAKSTLMELKDLYELAHAVRQK